MNGVTPLVTGADDGNVTLLTEVLYGLGNCTRTVVEAIMRVLAPAEHDWLLLGLGIFRDIL